MNWEALGSIAELVAALAVLATLIFLSMQIRTNNELTRRANRDKTVDQWHSWRQLLGSNREVASLWLRGCRGAELSEEESLQFTELARALFLICAVWALRAQENNQPDILDLASTTLSMELHGDSKQGLREMWLAQASETPFNDLVKSKL